MNLSASEKSMLVDLLHDAVDSWEEEKRSGDDDLNCTLEAQIQLANKLIVKLGDMVV